MWIVLVVKSVGMGHLPECPAELLGRKYRVSRDEILWREYRELQSRDDPEGLSRALRILNFIREAPE